MEEYTYVEGTSVLVDRAGRVVNPALIEYEDPTQPEELDVFVSAWQKQLYTQAIDSSLASRYVWPTEDYAVELRRLDIYQCDNPLCQQSSSNLAESRRIRNSGLFYPLRSMFFMGRPTASTTAIEVERVGPPPRTRLRPKTKKNARDQTIWTESESLNAFQGALGSPGSVDCFVDWTDGPDRYLFSSNLDPQHGWRRLWRFAAYPVTQYYILERRVEHEVFKDDLGYGYTYELARGPTLYAEKRWRLIGSFYAFDNELPCSNKYTVYTREDPFRRMVITMGESFDDADQWTVAFHFYAFDIPIPGSCVYYLNHSVRSINSTDAGIRRHRLTLEHPRLPWEFRMNIYVFPAGLEDCTITQTPPASKIPVNWGDVPADEQIEYYGGADGYAYDQTY